ncbi:MAG: UMP kinase [Planctomycetes bacterium]|nr:UMP kinase [Planctomycetota bacterium]
MTQASRFKRVLLKLSGEAFCAPGSFGVDSEDLRLIAREIKNAAQQGAQVAVVVGGGNIIRGAHLAKEGVIHRATADYMGMLGTVINGLALREALDELGQPARCMTAIDINAVAEPFIRLRAIRHLETGHIVVLAGGIGNPFFTTDTTAALRATELECDVVLKASTIDGVYTADPKKVKDATKYDRLTFAEAIEKRLKIMDATALAMCQEQNLPVLVFDFKKPGNITDAIAGKPVGTLITTK